MLRGRCVRVFLGVDNGEDFVGEAVLREAFGRVEGMFCDEGLDIGNWDKGEEFEIPLYVCVCSAKEELDFGQLECA